MFANRWRQGHPGSRRIIRVSGHYNTRCGLAFINCSGGGEGLSTGLVGRYFKSSNIDLLLSGWNTGVYFLKNLQFLMVPEPYTLTTFWWYWHTYLNHNSRFVPLSRVIAHLIWSRTWSPTDNGGKFLVCSCHHSWLTMWRFLKASSLAYKDSLNSWYLPGRIGTRSLMGLPNKHIAEDNLVSLSGVLRCCRIAR